jgi:hypothetical protein
MSDISDDSPRRLLSRRAQAKRYGRSVRTIERWGADARIGMPPEIKIGTQYFRYEHELEEMERRRVVQRGDKIA